MCSLSVIAISLPATQTGWHRSSCAATLPKTTCCPKFASSQWSHIQDGAKHVHMLMHNTSIRGNRGPSETSCKDTIKLTDPERAETRNVGIMCYGNRVIANTTVRGPQCGVWWKEFSLLLIQPLYNLVQKKRTIISDWQHVVPVGVSKFYDTSITLLDPRVKNLIL